MKSMILGVAAVMALGVSVPAAIALGTSDEPHAESVLAPGAEPSDHFTSIKPKKHRRPKDVFTSAPAPKPKPRATFTYTRPVPAAPKKR